VWIKIQSENKRKAKTRRRNIPGLVTAREWGGLKIACDPKLAPGEKE